MARRTGARRVDRHVGQRLRLRRKALGVSPKRLAATVSVTPEQLEDYERGANRISAAKLLDISRVLKVPVAFFFEGLRDPMSPETAEYGEAWTETLEALLDKPNGARLADLFMEVRRRSAQHSDTSTTTGDAANEADPLPKLPAASAKPTRH